MLKILFILGLIFISFLIDKHINLQIFLNGIILFISNLIIFFISVFIFSINFFISTDFAFIVIFICSILYLILDICLYIFFTKTNLSLAITIFNYYFFKQKIINDGIIKEGNIIAIKNVNGIKYLNAYYLIVNVNGRKIKSICFKNNSYNIGDKIKVGLYKKKSIILL